MTTIYQDKIYNKIIHKYGKESFIILLKRLNLNKKQALELLNKNNYKKSFCLILDIINKFLNLGRLAVFNIKKEFDKGIYYYVCGQKLSKKWEIKDALVDLEIKIEQLE